MQEYSPCWVFGFLARLTDRARENLIPESSLGNNVLSSGQNREQGEQSNYSPQGANHPYRTGNEFQNAAGVTRRGKRAARPPQHRYLFWENEKG